MNIAKTLIILFALTLLSACSQGSKDVNLLKQGMSQEKVISAYGNPDKTRGSGSSKTLIYNEPNDIAIEIYFSGGNLRSWRRVHIN